jgi:hypothetical protein
MMHGIFFYFQVAFMLLLFLATGSALYMGVFRAHRDGLSLSSKVVRGMLSAFMSVAMWFGLYSWSYLSW